MPSAQNKKVKASISLRIAALFVITFMVGLAAAFSVTYFQLQHSLEMASKKVIAATAREATTILNKEGLPGLKHFLGDEKNRVLNAHFLIRVLSTDGEVLFEKPSVQEKIFDFKNAFQTQTKPAANLGWHALSAIDDEDKFDILTAEVNPGLYLQVGKSSEDREEFLEQLGSVFIVTSGFFLLLGAILGTWYARKSLAPIRQMLSTIQEIENGDLSQRVNLGASQDELYQLGETFNRMIGRVESLIQVMRESLDNVAHEIRTPLTRMRIVSEDALSNEDAELLREALEDNMESAENIAELVDQVLSISEADSGTLSLNFERCDIKSLLEDVLEIYEFVAQDKHVEISPLEVPPGTYWNLDRKSAKQAVANLVDNAIKFSPHQGQISLSAVIEKNFLKISVLDQGVGVSESELSRIWDRLFRGDKNRSSKGSGLGLAIVRSIVHAHGGRVDAVRRQVGMEFSVSFPAR